MEQPCDKLDCGLINKYNKYKKRLFSALIITYGQLLWVLNHNHLWVLKKAYSFYENVIAIISY